MAEIVSKNIINPVGGENFYPDQTVEIEFDDIKLPDDQLFFDLFITIDYQGEYSSWDFVARLPIETKKYNLLLNKKIYGNNIRLATSGVSNSGLRSYKNVMAKSFTFKPRVVKDPIILNPVSNRTFSNSIDLIVDNSYLDIGEKNNLRFYAYFSSNKLSILNSAIAERIDTSNNRISWNVSDLPNSDDYEILCYYSDDYGNKSSDVSIKNINIINPGICIIDTEPPQAVIRVTNDSEYVSNLDISFNIYAYDEITEINGFIIKELKIRSGGLVEVKRSEPRNYGENNYYTVLNEDGKTYLGALVQDIAGNRTDYSLNYNSSLTFNINYFRYVNISIEDFDVTASDSTGSVAFFAAKKNGNYYLFKKEKMITLVSLIPKECVSLKIGGSQVLLSVSNAGSSLEIMKYDGTSLSPVVSLTATNTKCSTIEFYKNSFYLGCDHGTLFRLNGSTLVTIGDINKFEKPIKLIEKTKNNILNIYSNIGTKIFSYDGLNIVESVIII